MATPKEVKENLEMISTVKNVTATYQEIANLRMKQVREKVLKNREFFKELLDIYQRVKSAHLFSFKKSWLRKKRVSFRRAEKGKVIVFLSANQFFYGALILDIWKEIQNHLKKDRTDLAVVGRTGKYLVERSGFGNKMFYFELDDVKPEEDKIKGIVEFIKNYKKIFVFHGKYEKVLFQKTVISEISGKLPLEEENLTTEEEIKTYIFEPSPEEILDFFETEIIAALFNQTILEHQLARYASRVIAMYQATENAKNLEKNLSTIKNKLERQKLNKKQIELLSSLEL